MEEDPPQPHQLNWFILSQNFHVRQKKMHLLKTKDWMDTHNFPEDTKVRFCLTLTGEARLWYESIRPIEMDWEVLQECFRHQYSKFGSSRALFSHVEIISV